MHDNVPKKHKFEGLKKLLQSRKRRQSVSSVRNIRGMSMGMQTHRLLDAFVNYDAIEKSSDEDSSSSDSDTTPYLSDTGDEDPSDSSTSLRRNMAQSRNKPGGIAEATSPSPRQAVGGMSGLSIPSIIETRADNLPAESEPAQPRRRPPISRSPSSHRFSSSPIPLAKVSGDETSGPSIMFAAPNASPPSPPGRAESIYRRQSPLETPAAAASGFPAQAALPMSFNDLPSRAQHLILNELMVQKSAESVVLFTTLPSPLEGTSQTEAASEAYLRDLEILGKDLPPCLLVHSNSMTVTMNL